MPRTEHRGRLRRGGVWAVLPILALLASCTAPVATSPRPKTAPKVAAAAPQILDPSARSIAESARLLRMQDHLITQGLLRTDGGGKDTPFTDRQLAENFATIAFFDEYVASGGDLVARQVAAPLRRWDRPVRVRILFGESIPQGQRDRDRATITDYVNRLAAITGHSIRVADSGNFTVMILNLDEREAAEGRLRAAVPQIAPGAIRAVTRMPQETDCQMFAFTRGPGAAYTDAIAVIRGEQPELARLACLHEELAQGLGLPNDSPAARPSIFNDDEEFATLTRQDELMLKMLYDPRLKAGMTLAEARPIIDTMAAELLGPQT